jgi:hypothetical protein
MQPIKKDRDGWCVFEGLGGNQEALRKNNFSFISLKANNLTDEM